MRRQFPTFLLIGMSGFITLEVTVNYLGMQSTVPAEQFESIQLPYLVTQRTRKGTV